MSSSKSVPIILRKLHRGGDLLPHPYFKALKKPSSNRVKQRENK